VVNTFTTRWRSSFRHCPTSR